MGGRELARLASSPIGLSVTLSALDTEKVWSGEIVQIESPKQPRVHSHNVIVEIADTKGLLPVQLLGVQVTGKVYHDVLSLPEHMYGVDGFLSITTIVNILPLVSVDHWM